MAEAEMKTCHFVVEGAFLVDITRQLWADEGNPEKAFSILEAAFPQMRRSIMFAILTGEKKLVGDSDTGCYLEDDGTDKTPAGNRLSLEAVVGRFRKRIAGHKEWLRDVAQVRVSETEVETLARERVRRDEEYLTTCAESIRRMEEQDAKKKKPKPPKARRVIDNDHGWLSPAGKFYPCGYGEHIYLASLLGFEERELEKKQWMKCQGGDCYLPESEEPTQKQRDMIFDWFTSRNKQLPWWFEKEEE